jgi:hypothetical protein
MQKLIYPENVLDLIFGVKSEHAWTELNKNRQEAITLLEGAFFSFLQAELEKEDRNEEAIETQVEEGKFVTMRWDFNALEWITFYKLYFKEQKSIEEIAREMGLLEEEVHTMVARSLRALRYPSRSRSLHKYIKES